MRPRDELPYLEWAPTSGGTVRIYADAWKQEGLSATSVITEHAVESGAKVTDHIRPEPITVHCEMFFSEAPVRGDLDSEFVGQLRSEPLSLPEYPNNTPLLSPYGLAKATAAGINAIGNALGLGGGPTKASAMRFDSPPGRLRSVLEKVLQARSEGTLFTVGCSVLRVESMALKECSITRTAEDGDSGSIVFEFTQVQFVSTESAKAVPLPLEPRGQIKKNTSTGKASDVPAAKSSAAKTLLNGVGMSAAGSGV
jgi:hypothetical protein